MLYSGEQQIAPRPRSASHLCLQKRVHRGFIYHAPSVVYSLGYSLPRQGCIEGTEPDLSCRLPVTRVCQFPPGSDHALALTACAHSCLLSCRPRDDGSERGERGELAQARRAGRQWGRGANRNLSDSTDPFAHSVPLRSKFPLACCSGSLVGNSDVFRGRAGRVCRVLL